MPTVKMNGKGIKRRNFHDPLGQVIQKDIDRDKYATSRPLSRGKKKKVHYFEEEEELIHDKLSHKNLDMNKEQNLEIQIKGKKNQENECNEKYGIQFTDMGDNVEENFPLNSEEDFKDDTMVSLESGYVQTSDAVDKLSKEEEAVVETIMGKNENEKRNLADIILEKIAEKEEKQMSRKTENSTALPSEVVEVYTEIGRILNRYTSGKLPKAFKIIPSLSNWEEILYLTRPHEWTPQATFVATRIFASNLNPKMAQRFYYLVLLDRIRTDIAENKKLNYHYYMSLKKAVYKPAAFFKGILLPLCKEKCTLREAVIVSSVLQRVSIPVHHSAVAIHKLTEYEYNSAASVFLKVLLNKKYSLPVPVIDSMVQHFTSSLNTTVLPVLWHQCLLVFVQRYKNELDDEARELLRSVMKICFHPKITPEIRRELFGAEAWKEERDTVMST